MDKQEITPEHVRRFASMMYGTFADAALHRCTTMRDAWWTAWILRLGEMALHDDASPIFEGWKQSYEKGDDYMLEKFARIRNELRDMIGDDEIFEQLMGPGNLDS